MPLRALNWALPLESCGDPKVKYELHKVCYDDDLELFIVKVTLPSGKTYHSLFNEYGCYTYATVVPIIRNAQPKPKYRYAVVYHLGTGVFQEQIVAPRMSMQRTGYLVVETVLEGSATTYTIHKEGEEPKNE